MPRPVRQPLRPHRRHRWPEARESSRKADQETAPHGAGSTTTWNTCVWKWGIRTSTPPLPDAPSVEIRLPPGATSDTVREAVEEARRAITEAIEDAKNAKEEAQAAREEAEDAVREATGVRKRGGVGAQLLNAIEEAEALALLTDAHHVAQQKLDGNRVLVRPARAEKP